MNNHTMGFLIVGPRRGERTLVDTANTFGSYAACEPLAQLDNEAYLSNFCFSSDLADELKSIGSTRGFITSCWSPWLWWSINRKDELDAARKDAATLARFLCADAAIAQSDLLIFFSGSNGFHVGLPTAFIPRATPSLAFNVIARRMAYTTAFRAGVTIDCDIYNKCQVLRAPNSRHPKTGLYKRYLTLEALTELDVGTIVNLAKVPEPFAIPMPSPGACVSSVASEWNAAAVQFFLHRYVPAEHRPEAGQLLEPLTTDFIRNGAQEGDSERRLFSAAANLAEFGCPVPLAKALLTGSAHKSGLASREVCHLIEYGLRDSGSLRTTAHEAGEEDDDNR